MNFANITSLSDLKKKYRSLALANHPDKGGDLEKMKAINLEFEKLYEVWKDRDFVVNNGYDNDYTGATASQYCSYVENEYRWKGKRYDSNLGNKDISKLIREWLKETYPTYKFSVVWEHYSSLRLFIINADFEVFQGKHSENICYDVNHYHIESNEKLSDRAKEVCSNITDYVMSFNYNNSDVMRDYFDTNFYFTIGFGKSEKPYNISIPKLGTKDKVFKRPEGKTEKAIRLALGDAEFKEHTLRSGKVAIVLGKTHYYNNSGSFYPLDYSSEKTAQKRIEKLNAAGIRCFLHKPYRCGYIIFDGYTEEAGKALEEERKAADRSERIFNGEEQPGEKRSRAELIENIERKASPDEKADIRVVDYSEKAIAIYGNTFAIKDELKKIGARFNRNLKEGAGWILSKKHADDVANIIVNYHIA